MRVSSGNLQVCGARHGLAGLVELGWRHHGPACLGGPDSSVHTPTRGRVLGEASSGQTGTANAQMRRTVTDPSLCVLIYKMGIAPCLWALGALWGQNYALSHSVRSRRLKEAASMSRSPCQVSRVRVCSQCPQVDSGVSV